LPGNVCVGDPLNIAPLVQDFGLAADLFEFYDGVPGDPSTNLIRIAPAFQGKPRVTAPVFVNPAAAGGYTYYVVAVDVGQFITCTDTATISITVHDAPAAVSVADVTVCSGEALQVNFGNASGTALWTSDNAAVGLPAAGSGDINTTAAVNTTGAPITSNVVVRISNNGCTSTPDTVVVTVNPAPAISFGSMGPFCSGSSFSTSLTTNMPNVTFYWSAPANSGGMTGGSAGSASPIGTFTFATLTDQFTNTTNSPQTASYDVYAVSAAGCTSAVQTLVITINPEPALASGLMQSVCSGEAASLTLVETTSLGAVFNWPAPTAPAGLVGLNGAPSSSIFPGSSSITDAYLNLTSSPIAVDYMVTPSVLGGCPGQTETVTLTVRPATVWKDTTIIGCQTFANFGNVALPQMIGGRSVSYYLTPSGQVYTSPNYLGQDNEVLTAVFDGNPCDEVSFVTIDIQPLPPSPTPGFVALDVCDGDTAMLSFAMTTNVYSDPAMMNLIASAVTSFDTTVAPGQTINLYAKSVNTATGCESSLAARYLLTGRSLPVISGLASASSYCSDSVNNVIMLDGIVTSAASPYQSIGWSHPNSWTSNMEDAQVDAGMFPPGMNTFTFALTDA
jgi:hypothetical protein